MVYIMIIKKDKQQQYIISNEIIDAVDDELEYNLPDNRDVDIRNESKVVNGVLGEEKIFEILSNQIQRLKFICCNSDAIEKRLCSFLRGYRSLYKSIQ